MLKCLKTNGYFLVVWNSTFLYKHKVWLELFSQLSQLAWEVFLSTRNFLDFLLSRLDYLSLFDKVWAWSWIWMNIYSEKRGGAVYRQGDTHEGDTGLRNWCKTEITIFEFFSRKSSRLRSWTRDRWGRPGRPGPRCKARRTATTTQSWSILGRSQQLPVHRLKSECHKNRTTVVRFK